MKKQIPIFFLLSLVAFLNTSSASDTSQLDLARAQFIAAFNDRNWEEVNSLFSDDAVFHRMNADTIYTGPDQIVGRFKETIAGEWNVKFVRLDNVGWMAGTGENTNTVDSGQFAITAGGDSDSCYAGFYTMTWNKDMKIMVFTWQDVQVDMTTCQ